MASAFGHSLVGFTVTGVSGAKFPRAKLYLFSVLGSILPDVDAIGFKFGVPYGSPLGHRGFTHSILFALLWTFTVWFFAFRNESRQAIIAAVLFISIISHACLDAMTNGGMGVGFFIPFDNDRYFFPFRPIAVSPIGVGNFFQHAGHILVSEFIWIGIPCLMVLGLKQYIVRKKV